MLRQYAEHNSQSAFEQLTQRHLNMVFSTCRRELNDPDLAEDVCQVVFLILARKASSLRGSGSLAGWIFTTARLACKNAQRQEIRRRKTEQEAFMQMESHDTKNQGALWDELEPRLNHSLSKLKETQRTAILLRFFENKSLQETGAQLGISEDAARMLVNRAIEKLRRLLSRKETTISATVLSTLLAERAAQAASPQCVETMSQLSHHITAHSINSWGATRQTVQDVSQGVLREMIIAKTKILVAATLCVTVVLGGTWTIQQNIANATGTPTKSKAESKTTQSAGFFPRLRLKANTSFLAKIANDQTISLVIQGQTIDVVRMLDIGYRFDVQDVAENGDMTLKITYDSIYIYEKSPAMTIEYDSAQPREITPLARYLTVITGKSITAKLSPTGKVLEMQGVPEFLEALKTEQAKASLPAHLQDTINKGVDQGFGEATIKTSIESTTQFYPESPMQVGNSWTAKEVGNFGAAQANEETKFTLASRKDGKSKIELQGTSTINPASGGLQIGVVGVCKDGQGSGNGTLEVDEVTGWPTTSESQSTLTGTLEPLASAPAGAKAAPMTIKTKSRVSIKPAS